MRILHALHGFPPEFFGGSELYVRALAQTQVARGHSVEILAGTNEEGPPGLSSSEHMGLKVHRIRRSGIFHERWDHGDSPAGTTLYRELLHDFRPDIVHVHHWKRLSRDLVRLAAADRIPAVLTLHDLFVTCPRVFRVRPGESFCERPLSPESCGDCVPREGWMGSAVTAMQIEWFSMAFREELAAASALVVPSAAHARILSGHMGRDVADFDVLPHGSILEWGPVEVSSSWSGEGPLRIAHWGHLQELKGVHVLAEALSRLEDKSRIELVLWGEADDPSFGKKLDELLDGIHVERREEFTRDDLPHLQAHLAVFATLAHESHSFVLDEAFSLGLPVLASDRGALPERIGQGGIVFPAGDAQALADLLTGILEHPSRLDALRSAMPQPLSMPDHSDCLEKVYLRAASRDAVSPPGQALARSRRYEEFVQILEARCREIDGLREKVTSETKNLERSIVEYEGSLAAHASALVDKDEDLEAHHVQLEEMRADLNNHRAQVEEMRADLDSHRSELARANRDFELTEAALIKSEKHKEEILAEKNALGEELAAERVDHSAAVANLQKAISETERLFMDLQNAILNVNRISGRVDELEESEARLEDERAGLTELIEELTAINARLHRENRLALPLVLPARLLIAIKDRLMGPPEGGTPSHTDRNRE